MSAHPLISDPADPLLDDLCKELAIRADQIVGVHDWPGEQLAACARYGVYRWFLPEQWGGSAWSDADIVRGYLRLSAVCMTTTFIITQLTGACRRIAACDDGALKAQLLPDLAAGKSFATLGISHLTTSRRHLAQPVLRAAEVETGFVLDGFSPWVTGATHAQFVVIGATLDDRREVAIVLPTQLSGVLTPEPTPLIGFSASRTGPVQLDNVLVDRKWLLDGPVENVMSRGAGGGTGGLQTSTLAIGLSEAAVSFLQQQADRRADLSAAASALCEELNALRNDLLDVAGGAETCTTENLRVRANDLVLRSTQAALAAAKGTGYVVGHSAGRWCCEALFFLVWSCPQPVMAAQLCELAGISD